MLKTNITTSEQLLNWAAHNDATVTMTIEAAQIILDYFEGHSYGLVLIDNKLFREDLDAGNSSVEEYSLRDVVDCVFTWNQEFIEIVMSAIRQPESLEEYWMAMCDHEVFREHKVVLDGVAVAY